jgi:hypothetical protein
MLLQSLRAHCTAPGGTGSIWKYLKALVKATGMSGRFVCGFRTDLHFADIPTESIPMYDHSWPQHHSVHVEYNTNRARSNGEYASRGR